MGCRMNHGGAFPTIAKEELMNLREICLAFTAAVVLTLGLSTPSRADTLINVSEDGEGGMPMTIKLDQSMVKAGPVTFNVHNEAAGEEHEMILVKLKSADQEIPLDKAKHRVDEKKLKSIGEVSELKPGAKGQLKAKLTAGTYLLYCNVKGHYEAGMFTKLAVAP